MRSIICIQHTQSVHHTNGMVGSWTDWDITNLGIQQANKIGENLKKKFSQTPFVMYSSDLLRAKHTAEIVGSYLGVSPILVAELRERNLGKCIGKSVSWMREHMEMQEHTVDDRMFSDAESRRDEWNRLLPFYEEKIKHSTDNIIIVSHGDLLSVFQSMWLGLTVESMNAGELFGMAGGVSILMENDDGKHVIKSFSDMSFMH